MTRLQGPSVYPVMGATSDNQARAVLQALLDESAASGLASVAIEVMLDPNDQRNVDVVTKALREFDEEESADGS